ncbi:MAG TPA: HAMP domain-containing sensor histidine kinase [Micropepsaceae bacterium]|nr:HAMP domain-containing sensor histidine kinase [Micropepsaceae bacterium]
MLAAAQGWLATRLRPRNTLDARVRIDQLQAIASTNINSAPFTALIAIVVALLDLQWVPPALISVWALSVLGSLAWAYWGTRKALAREIEPEDAGAFTLDMIVWTTPFMVLWPTMILYVWIPGNPLNNGFLVTFLFVSMAASVMRTGLCRYIALPGMLAAISLLATHSLSGTTLMDWLGPVLQILAGVLICNLSFAFEKKYRLIVLQGFEKEALAHELANTAEELSIARDLAQEASKAKSLFLANMSHELRTPLNAIIGFSDLVRSQTLGPVTPPKYGDYVEDVYKSGVHLLSLINNLLDLAKIEAGKYEMLESRIELDHVTANALRFVEMQARKGGVTLRTEIQDRVGLVADERAVTQVLTNLLSNAVKFTEPGGSVTVFAHIVSDGALALGVKDTGIGMDPEDVRRALEPFVQVAHIATVEGWGSGLGVPLAKSLIEAHGGSFHIESHHGIGTCAWGEFPSGRAIALGPLEMVS